MSGLSILLTNITLASRTGTETYIADVARGLLARGHRPVVYCTDQGEIAREIEAATVPIVADLNQLTTVPDVIHGHHFAETLTALLHFPGTPAVGFCHDWSSFWDTPVRFPRLRRYVAVDDTCRDRLIARHGVPQEQVRVVLNAADLRRFPPRPPLPSQPRRAVLFSNLAGEDNCLGAVRNACTAAGIALDVIGQRAGAPCARPGDVLGQYDVVFAKARCALEAMAVGAAVILCDVTGVGGLVVPANFAALRRLNFGRRSLCEPARTEVLARELARYSAGDAAEVSRRVRSEASLEGALDELLGIYREVIAEQRREGAADAAAEGRAAADGVRWLTPYFREIYTRRADWAAALQERDDLKSASKVLESARNSALQQLAAVHSEAALARQQAADCRAAHQRELQAMHSQQAELLRQAGAAHPHVQELQAALADVQRSTAVRLARRLRSLPLLPRVARLVRRGLRRLQ